MAEAIAPDLKEIQDKIEDSLRLEWRDPTRLAPNDLNWKKHGSAQRRAYRELKSKVGYVGALLYNERTERLLDGHMRQEEAIENGDTKVPVLVVNVDEATENLILLYLDKVGSIFGSDMKMVETLQQQTDSIADQVLAGIWSASMADADRDDDDGNDNDGGLKRKAFPEGGLALSLGAKFDYVVLLFRTEVDWNAAQDHFGIARQKCPFSSTVGVGRVVDGAAYLARIQSGKTIAETREDDLVTEILNEAIAE